MAIVAGVKIANRVKKKRNPIFFDEKYTGPEPAWDTERASDMSDDDFDHHLRPTARYSWCTQRIGCSRQMTSST